MQQPSRRAPRWTSCGPGRGRDGGTTSAPALVAGLPQTPPAAGQDGWIDPSSSTPQRRRGRGHRHRHRAAGAQPAAAVGGRGRETPEQLEPAAAPGLQSWPRALHCRTHGCGQRAHAWLQMPPNHDRSVDSGPWTPCPWPAIPTITAPFSGSRCSDPAAALAGCSRSPAADRAPARRHAALCHRESPTGHVRACYPYVRVQITSVARAATALA